jgi:hypothetical protein
MRVAEVSDPRAPVEIARSDTLGYVSGVAAAGGDNDAIYVASGGDLRVVDIGDIQSPRLEEIYPIPGEANDLAIEPGQGNRAPYLYLAEGPLFRHRQWLGGGLRIFSLQQGRPVEVAFVDTPGQAKGVGLADRLVYLANGNDGLRVYETVHPAQLREMAVQDLASEVRDVTVGRGRVHIAGFGRGISAGVATAPSGVTIDHRYEAVVFARGLGEAEDRPQDGLLYVAESMGDPDPVLTGRRGQDDGLHILAVDRPDAVRQVGFVATPGDIRNLTVLGAGEGNRVRLVVADGGLLFLEEEVMSTLIRFDGISLPAGAQVTNAVLSLYYSGQSVNGGAVGVLVSGPYRGWQPPQTTWVNWRTSQSWQADGAKGVEDRGLYVSERIVNYTEVGTWLNFNISDLVQAGEYEFLLHAAYRGVNKDIKIASNEYWDATKRPKLMIWYTQ